MKPFNFRKKNSKGRIENYFQSTYLNLNILFTFAVFKIPKNKFDDGRFNNKIFKPYT